MGPVVSVQDAPEFVVSGPEDMGRQVDTYGCKIGNFERIGIIPDSDIYGTGSIVANETYYVAVFPSFFVFDEIFDKESGSVSIEVLDDKGNLYPFEEVPLSDTAEALALVSFTAGPGSPEYYYRIRPLTGFQHGEYVVIDTTLLAAGATPETLDGESRPPAYSLMTAYNQPEVQDNYTDITVGGSPLKVVTSSGIVRFGFLSAGSEVDFEIKTASSDPQVQRFLMDQGGDILLMDNLTLTDGNVNFRVNTARNEISMVALRFPSDTSVQAIAKHADSASGVATYSCISKAVCPSRSIEISGLPTNDIVALDLSMFGTFNTALRAIQFADGNSGANYGSFQRDSQDICGIPISRAGVIFGRTTSAGKVEVEVVPPDTVPFCLPKIGITLKAVDVAEHLDMTDVLGFESSVRSFCDNLNCTSGSLVFEGVPGQGIISTLAMVIQGFAASMLTLSMDNDVFYNLTLPSQVCTDDPTVLEGIVIPPITGSEALSISYELSQAVVCSDRQSLVLGVVGFSGPSSDLALIIGLTVAAAIVVVAAVAYSRSKSGLCTGSEATALKTKEGA